jgi:aminoglycoside/choline kinase family phosphotransferase
VDVPQELETALFSEYCAARRALHATFDKEAFSFAYAALGAQRNTKILGIFARLAKRDAKPQYLKHIPRIWRYAERSLAHPELGGLRAWYDRHLPPDIRAAMLNI